MSTVSHIPNASFDSADIKESECDEEYDTMNMSFLGDYPTLLKAKQNIYTISVVTVISSSTLTTTAQEICNLLKKLSSDGWFVAVPASKMFEGKCVMVVYHFDIKPTISSDLMHKIVSDHYCKLQVPKRMKKYFVDNVPNDEKEGYEKLFEGEGTGCYEGNVYVCKLRGEEVCVKGKCHSSFYFLKNLTGNLYIVETKEQ